jgi:hypothetical protein
LQLQRPGQLTAQDADARSRSVHALAFRKVQVELAAAWVQLGDPRLALLHELRQLVGWMVEPQAIH